MIIYNFRLLSLEFTVTGVARPSLHTTQDTRWRFYFYAVPDVVILFDDVVDNI